MPDRHRAMWTAFFLSLAVPGAGQLWAGRWSCLTYFAAVVGLTSPRIGPSRWAAVAALGLVSAGHAWRCVAEGARPRKGASIATRCRVVDRSRRGSGIDVLIEVEADRPAEDVWGFMADLPAFVTIDPFHRRVIVSGPGASLKPGVELTIEHLVFGRTFFRFGKLLTWREGSGYSFSDLSPKGAEGFFPHVFDFDLTPIGEGGVGSRLTVSVRGKWASRVWPNWLGRRWVAAVSREHARMLRSALARPGLTNAT